MPGSDGSWSAALGQLRTFGKIFSRNIAFSHSSRVRCAISSVSKGTVLTVVNCVAIRALPWNCSFTETPNSTRVCWMVLNGLVSFWTKGVFLSFPSGSQDICWIICVDVAFVYWSKNTSANNADTVKPSLAACCYDSVSGIQSSSCSVFKNGFSTITGELMIFKRAYAYTEQSKLIQLQI